MSRLIYKFLSAVCDFLYELSIKQEGFFIKLSEKVSNVLYSIRGFIVPYLIKKEAEEIISRIIREPKGDTFIKYAGPEVIINMLKELGFKTIKEEDLGVGWSEVLKSSSLGKVVEVSYVVKAISVDYLSVVWRPIKEERRRT